MTEIERFVSFGVWMAVPAEVVRLTKLAARPYGRVRCALEDAPCMAWLQAETGEVVTENVRAATMLKAAGIECSVREKPFPADEPWVPVKSAEIKTPFQLASLTPSKLNAPFGGATPLASTLTGGLLGAGLGYAGGALAEHLLPESVVQRGKLRKLTAVLGGLGGAAPGMWLGSEAVRNYDGPGSKWNALTQPNNLFGHTTPHQIDLEGHSSGVPAATPRQTNTTESSAEFVNDMRSDTKPPAIPDEATRAASRRRFDQIFHKRSEFGSDPIRMAGEALREMFPDDAVSEDFMKDAMEPGFNGAGGGLYIPSIPVDAFNRMILADPFAPMQLQAATMGLTEAANQSRGNIGLISPYDIARIGLGMGAGLTQAYLGGKVLGALAGLTPSAQRQLQQAGMVAGAIKAVVPGLFGR